MEPLARLRELEWGWLVLGVSLGLAACAGLIYWLGGWLWRRMRLFRSVPWAAELPHPFPKDQVVCRYVRRKREHRHDRHYYQRHARKGHGAKRQKPSR